MNSLDQIIKVGNTKGLQHQVAKIYIDIRTFDFVAKILKLQKSYF